MKYIDWLFVIAFTLNDRLLWMHLFDCSGIVSSYPIDIHNVSSWNLSMIRQEQWCVSRNLCFSLLPLLAALLWHQNSLAGIHQSRFGMVIMLFHHIGLRCSSLHQITMYLGLSLHSVPSKSQRASINQWQHYVMIQCLTLQNAKWLWERATIVMEVVSLEDWKNKNEKVRYLWWDEWHADLSLSQTHIYIMKQL